MLAHPHERSSVSLSFWCQVFEQCMQCITLQAPP